VSTEPIKVELWIPLEVDHTGKVTRPSGSTQGAYASKRGAKSAVRYWGLKTPKYEDERTICYEFKSHSSNVRWR
jgi:hypothetical protein